LLSDLTIKNHIILKSVDFEIRLNYQEYTK
jgi:hypothetical protein